ncbi:hypothetical protein V5E97_04340 [Singulisphaera sp. Ch08]|uniref:Transposase n=1 Tax=Singulisphaera sp. Ch08 TaxID=3120278 RepID=A0AAU7CJ42_9BACT
MADAGFGIFQVAHAMVLAGHDILFRLTKTRFESMRRRAKIISQTAHGMRYRLKWTPSAKEHKTNPDLPADASVMIELHEVKLETGEPLYLVTTLGNRESSGRRTLPPSLRCRA